jgi:hypothetical protein
LYTVVTDALTADCQTDSGNTRANEPHGAPGGGMCR